MASLGLIAALAIASSVAYPAELNGAGAANIFASMPEAEAYLSRALPAATAANPKYRSKDSDIETRWLTKTVAFRDSGAGGIIMSTQELIEDYRNGALSDLRTHEATFALDAVAISEETADDLTENGERARGILFTCAGAPCIEAVWSGEAIQKRLDRHLPAERNGATANPCGVPGVAAQVRLAMSGADGRSVRGGPAAF